MKASAQNSPNNHCFPRVCGPGVQCLLWECRGRTDFDFKCCFPLLHPLLIMNMFVELYLENTELSTRKEKYCLCILPPRYNSVNILEFYFLCPEESILFLCFFDPYFITVNTVSLNSLKIFPNLIVENDIFLFQFALIWLLRAAY